MRHLAVVVVVMVAMSGFTRGQEGVPATSNVPGQAFPRVDSED